MKQTPFYSSGKYNSDAVVRFQKFQFSKKLERVKNGTPLKNNFFQVQHTLIWYQIGSTLHADSKRGKKSKIITTEF